jgi:hypothetical protein
MEQGELETGISLTGNVLFYTKPEPLSAQTHGALGVNRTAKPYGFVSGTNLVPLTVAEFIGAGLSYPIVFLGDGKIPLAVMGLRPNENLFVSSEGEFKVDAYIPSFVRRYPFVFANDEGSDRMVLCVDRDAPFISDNPEVPFFENGQPSAYTQSAMQFCTEFETERQRTQSFVNMMQDMDLFEFRESNFQPTAADGSPMAPVKLADYWAISNDKLNALPHDKFVMLRDNGALPQIYAHLISLLAWDKLVALQLERQSKEGAPAAANA